ncbi:MAG: alpha-2-macroglobulin family protein [Myxococcales bacterium]
MLELRGPKGEVLLNTNTASQDGVWALNWTVPEGQAGGEYTLKVTYPWHGHAGAERKFDVRVYRAPRLKSQIVFLRDGYGPGDKVTATLDVKRAEGGVPAGAKVTASARVDGAEVASVPATVDSVGRCTVSFDLPVQIAKGEGSLAFAIEDGGVVETATKTIPILLQTLDLALYPEGGDLVPGVPNRVYFQARTPAQKPADIVGDVVKAGTNEKVASFKSEHEGRGRFELTPVAGARYELRVTEPAGIRTPFAFPENLGAVALKSAQDLAAGKEPLRFQLSSASGRAVKVTLSARERELSSQKVSLAAGSASEVSLDAKDGEGVLTATVWDEQGTPLAERLVFRKPAKALTIEIKADRQNYVPGGEASLTVKTLRDGKAVSALVGLTVTDDSVLEMIEKREQAPRLPVMALLEPEVKDLADAHVYLDEKNPKAPLAVDLLLGTQGWRRFATARLADLQGPDGDALKRALAFRIPPPPQPKYDIRRKAMAAMEGAAPPPAPVAVAMPQAAPMPMKKGEAMEEKKAMKPGAPPPPAAPAPVVAQGPMRAPAAERAVGTGRAGLAKDRGILAGKADLDEDFAQARIAFKPPPVFVREFAHQVRTGRQPTDRVDFAETLYWNAGVKTDVNGEATVKFGLSDAVTTFRAFADGVAGDGALGSASAGLESVQPFYVEAKLPLEVTSGDVIRLPIALVNGTEQPLPGGSLDVRAGGDLRIGAAEAKDLAAQERARRLVDVTVGVQTKPVEITFTGKAGAYTDNLTRTLAIAPRGFPYATAFGGMLKPNGAVAHTIKIPAAFVPNSVTTRISAFPTPLASMTEALQRLIREPCGCFEQTSSTTYPLVMAQQYFLSHQGVDPKLVEESKDKLERGYQRLTGFQCKDKGYEWFGQDPSHEALTAFGVMEFTDMSKVKAIDTQMLSAARDWLSKQRDGQGGFKRARRALHTWIEDKDCSNGYILWSLLETGEKGLEKEVAAFREAAPKSQNSYVWALGANVQALAGNAGEAKSLMEKLAAKQQQDGSVGGSTTSIVGSGGEALTVETTSLAALAWMRDPSFAGQVERAIKYLADVCKGGRYGSTQSTVLALRAIVTYDQARAKPKASGSVRVYVDGQPVGSEVAFDEKTHGAIVLPEIAEPLGKGDHKVELKTKNGAPMPYTIEVRYNALTPNSAADCKVDLDVKLAQETVTEGQVVEAYATVTNKAQELIPTTVAIVGLPGGLEPRHDQLKELVKKGTVDAYEVLGRDVVLYWRGMQPGSKVEVPLSLVAGVPGTYTGAASRAYLYYTDELKTWKDGLKVAIAPK